MSGTAGPQAGRARGADSARARALALGGQRDGGAVARVIDVVLERALAPAAVPAVLGPVAGEQDAAAIGRGHGLRLGAVGARGAVVVPEALDGAAAVQLHGHDLGVEAHARLATAVGDVEPARPQRVPGGAVHETGLVRGIGERRDLAV